MQKSKRKNHLIDLGDFLFFGKFFWLYAKKSVTLQSYLNKL